MDFSGANSCARRWGLGIGRLVCLYLLDSVLLDRYHCALVGDIASGMQAFCVSPKPAMQ